MCLLTPVQNIAHSVVCSGCLTGYSHIHEVGHNMGLLHDRETSGVAPGATGASGTDWDYGFGYRWVSAVRCCNGIVVRHALKKCLALLLTQLVPPAADATGDSRWVAVTCWCSDIVVRWAVTNCLILCVLTQLAPPD